MQHRHAARVDMWADFKELVGKVDKALGQAEF
jgi:hypothetical protein